MSKKQAKTKQNGNNIKDVVGEDISESLIRDISGNSQTPQIDETILRWLLGSDLKSAALSAGYSQSYSESGVQRAIRRALKGEGTKMWGDRLEKIAGALPDRYRQLCRLRLPAIADIEGKVLQEMAENPKLAAEKPTMLRQIKASAGVLAEDPHGPQVLSVGTMNFFQDRLRTAIEDKNTMDGKCEEIPDEGGEKS